MPIKAKFDVTKIVANLERKLKTDLTDDVAEAFELTAQQIVNAAKANDTYKDQTNLLRSSIGFVLYRNGHKVKDYFASTSKNPNGTAGESGVQKGLEAAEQAAQAHPNAIVACIVAGANYALAVESKGYDVITSHTKDAPQLILQWLKDIEDALGGSPDGGEQLSLFD